VKSGSIFRAPVIRANGSFVSPFLPTVCFVFKEIGRFVPKKFSAVIFHSRSSS